MTDSGLPPTLRSHTALGLLRGVASGALVLQRCAECATVQYPPREACHRCLGADLPWSEVADGGEVLASTLVRVSNEEFFRARAPWRVGLVLADCGPRIVTHLARGSQAGDRVRIEPRVDSGGRPVLVAFPIGSDVDDFPDFATVRPESSVLVTETESELGSDVLARVSSRVRRVLTGQGDASWDLVLDTRV